MENAISKDTSVYQQLQLDMKDDPEKQLEEVKRILGIHVNKMMLENLYLQLKYDDKHDTIYGFSKKFIRVAKHAGRTNFNDMITDFVHRLPNYYEYQYNKRIDEFENLDWNKAIEKLVDMERKRNLKNEFKKKVKSTNEKSELNSKKETSKINSKWKETSSVEKSKSNANPNSPAKSNSAPRGRGNSGTRGTPRGTQRGTPRGTPGRFARGAARGKISSPKDSNNDGPKSKFSNDANHFEKKDSNSNF